MHIWFLAENLPRYTLEVKHEQKKIIQKWAGAPQAVEAGEFESVLTDSRKKNLRLRPILLSKKIKE